MKQIHLAFNASGAAEAGRRGDVTVIVDVIDMSTSAEAALENEAAAIFGAAPTGANPPVAVNPEEVGFRAGKLAVRLGTEMIIIAEPRYGSDEERRKRAESVLAGVRRAGAVVSAILPNIGAEVVKLANFHNKVVVVISDAGGVAFDAAVTYGAPEVLTATVARTLRRKGTEPVRAGAERTLQAARRHEAGITVVAASANAFEDVLASQYLVQLLIAEGFLKLT